MNSVATAPDVASSSACQSVPVSGDGKVFKPGDRVTVIKRFTICVELPDKTLHHNDVAEGIKGIIKELKPFIFHGTISTCIILLNYNLARIINKRLDLFKRPPMFRMYLYLGLLPTMVFR